MGQEDGQREQKEDKGDYEAHWYYEGVRLCQRKRIVWLRGEVKHIHGTRTMKRWLMVARSSTQNLVMLA